MGLTEGDVIMNVLDPARIAQLITGYNPFKDFTDASFENWNWSIVSFYAFGSVRGTPVVSKVTSITCDSTIDSMRKRIPGH